MWRAWCRRAPPPAAVLGAAAFGAVGHLRGAPRAQCEPPGATVSIGCYNVLCPTYAVKWGEREGKGADGASNWAVRWPAIRGILNRARWDVVCLQEVEQTDAAEIAAGLGPEYATFYFKHERRPPDGLMIAVRTEAFDPAVEQRVLQHNGVAFARVDLVHRSSGRTVRVLTAHCRGGKAEQLAALADFADDGAENPDLTVVTGDFNEDFHSADRTEVRCPFPDGLGRYQTLLREAGLPELSRPPHKQAPDQSSGKGKIDYIFVRGTRGRCAVELFRDPASRVALLASHAPCSATGQWPSDHGAEGLSVRLLAPQGKENDFAE